MRQPAVRQLRRFRRPRRRLRAGLVQLLCVLAGLGLGLLLPRISTGSSVASTRVTEALVTIGFGTLGLVSVIFSLLFLVVQWAFGSLSPRLNYLRTSLDDLIESGAGSPMVLLRARALLITLLSTAPPQRRPSIAWRLQHAQDLMAGNFPAIWRDAGGQDPG